MRSDWVSWPVGWNGSETRRPSVNETAAAGVPSISPMRMLPPSGRWLSS